MLAEHMPMFRDTNCMKLPSRSEQKACADSKLMRFISSNIRFFDPLIKKGTKVKTVLYFVVGVDDSLSGFQVVKGNNLIFNQEAIRVIKLTEEKNGPWIPAIKKSSAVPLRIHLPIKLCFR